MGALESILAEHILLAWVVLIVAFVVLAKCADVFVDSSVALANKLHVPTLVIGIVLVSLATTAPELCVSLLSALSGKPEMALGNAIGSVICDDGLALALCGLASVSVISIIPRVLKSCAFFLILVEVLAFLFVAFDNSLERGEGAVLVCLFVGYVAHLFREHRRGSYRDEIDADMIEKALHASLAKIAVVFAISLAGIIASSEFVICSATAIAHRCGIPEAVVALTLVAFGTSIPEVATCVAAARKRQGALAVGNILGADIMNICWVAGASAMANDLTLARREIYFMFPAMFAVVGVMLVLLRAGYRLTRTKGLVLLITYILYLVSFFVVFRPGS